MSARVEPHTIICFLELLWLLQPTMNRAKNSQANSSIGVAQAGGDQQAGQAQDSIASRGCQGIPVVCLMGSDHLVDHDLVPIANREMGGPQGNGRSCNRIPFPGKIRKVLRDVRIASNFLAILALLYLELEARFPKRFRCSSREQSRLVRLYRAIWTQPIFVKTPIGMITLIDIVIIVIVFVCTIWIWIELLILKLAKVDAAESSTSEGSFEIACLRARLDGLIHDMFHNSEQKAQPSVMEYIDDLKAATARALTNT